MSMNKIVIVGGGNAGVQVADSLRRGGYDGRIDLFCAEHYLPYQRPPLSKKYLEGTLATERLFIRPEKFYDTRQINVHTGVSVTALDRDSKTVTASNGEQYPYDKLVLATGADVRKMPGTDEKTPLYYIRGIDDVAALQQSLEGGSKKVALVGGGFIGLETAATLTRRGHTVTVIEAMPSIMPGLVAPVLAHYIRDMHTENGVRVIENTPVEHILHQNGKYTLSLADGESLNADMVVVGIGVIPATQVAETAGLTCERGILVNAHAQTNDPDIYAVGDCANGMHMRFQQHTRLESVQNAVDQATVAAKHILGEDISYDALPWFWSDQYDMKLQMAGLSRGYDECIVRGEMAEGKFSICYFRGGELIAIDSVNAVPDHMAARRLLTAGITLTPTQCSDASIPLKTYL